MGSLIRLDEGYFNNSLFTYCFVCLLSWSSLFFNFPVVFRDGNVALSRTTGFSTACSYSQKCLAFRNTTSWKYNDKGVNLGQSFTKLTFDDSSFATGYGVLGYLVNATSGVKTFQTPLAKERTTYYFRRVFRVANASCVNGATINFKVTDGAVGYINGKEVWRYNMPASGIINYSTLATVKRYTSDYSNSLYLPQLLNLASKPFVSGNNVFAVEVHSNQRIPPTIAWDAFLTLQYNMQC